MARISLNPTKAIHAKQPYIRVVRQVNGKRTTVRIPIKDAEITGLNGPYLGINLGGRPGKPAKNYKLSAWNLVDLNVAKQQSFKNADISGMLWEKGNEPQKVKVKNSPLELVTEMFNSNAYRSLVLGANTSVAYIYSKKSRVIQGTENLLAVRMSNGNKGWLTVNGEFISQDAVSQLMSGLDGTVASGRYDFSFKGLWDSMNARQRADFVDMVKDLDWDVFWKEKYDPNSPLSEEWVETLDSLVDSLMLAIQ